MLTKLDKDRRELILEYCLERFDIPNHHFENYSWYIGSKNRIYIGPDELERVRPESIGLCIFRINKTPKPTTNFIQLFGQLITKNTIEINKNDVIDFCSGKDLNTIVINVVPGFVAVNHKGQSIGCGHWNGNLLKNQMPKSRFCKINFL